MKAGRLSDPFARMRMLAVLVLCFSILPGASLLSVGILVLAFASRGRDVVFGMLVLALATTLTAGITLTYVYVRKASSLARLQTDFVHQVSHDLRTPLASIRLFVDALEHKGMSDATVRQECVAALSRETSRLTSMVERLLGWAKMEAGKREYRRLRVQPADVVDTAIAAVQPQVDALAGSATLVRDFQPCAPVDVDPTAMSEAIVGLLQNAILYTGVNKRIVVSCCGHGREVEIAVADNGPGIPKPQQRLIFTKFYRAVDPTKAGQAGTGLGLAIVRNIVRSHHGRVNVESELGSGATFQIFLPAATGA
jgi:two-component system, OmpR family, phosphate regulon sensor histidine kinase PhoR